MGTPAAATRLGHPSARGGSPSAQYVLPALIDRAYGSPDRLRDAADLLTDEHREHREARALLVRATRRAADPQPPAHPRPFAPPDAPRPRRPEG